MKVNLVRYLLALALFSSLIRQQTAATGNFYMELEDVLMEEQSKTRRFSSAIQKQLQQQNVEAVVAARNGGSQHHRYKPRPPPGYQIEQAHAWLEAISRYHDCIKFFRGFEDAADAIELIQNIDLKSKRLTEWKNQIRSKEFEYRGCLRQWHQMIAGTTKPFKFESILRSYLNKNSLSERQSPRYLLYDFMENVVQLEKRAYLHLRRALENRGNSEAIRHDERDMLRRLSQQHKIVQILIGKASPVFTFRPKHSNEHRTYRAFKNNACKDTWKVSRKYKIKMTTGRCRDLFMVSNHPDPKPFVVAKELLPDANPQPIQSCVVIGGTSSKKNIMIKCARTNLFDLDRENEKKSISHDNYDPYWRSQILTRWIDQRDGNSTIFKMKPVTVLSKSKPVLKVPVHKIYSEWIQVDKPWQTICGARFKEYKGTVSLCINVCSRGFVIKQRWDCGEHKPSSLVSFHTHQKKLTGNLTVKPSQYGWVTGMRLVSRSQDVISVEEQDSDNGFIKTLGIEIKTRYN